MFSTYLNVKGPSSVLEKTKEVWASTFDARAIAYRLSKKLGWAADLLGVAVVKMVDARAAGVSFSIDPVKRDASRMLIEATWGLGEGVVKGTESVDRFILHKQTLEIIERQIGRKERQVIPSADGIKWEDVPPDRQGMACLTDDEAKGVGLLTRRLEERLGRAQDTEWAVEEGRASERNIYLLQTRPAKGGTNSTNSPTDQMCDDMLKSFRRIDVSKLKFSGGGFKF
jgi:pyruvate,water dikinase